MVANHSQYYIKQLTEFDEFKTLVELQRKYGDIEPKFVLPARNFAAVMDKGGAALGLFDEKDTLRGFISHFPGRYKDEVVGWSFRLVIDPAICNNGFEEKLKENQKNIALEEGLKKLYWTADPLQIRSTCRSLKLPGTSSDRYLHKFYEKATMINEKILEPDCLLIHWDLLQNQVKPLFDAKTIESASAILPVGNEIPDSPPSPSLALNHQNLQIFIPGGKVLLEKGTEALRAWRRASREAFLHYFENGYIVNSMQLNDENNPTGATYFLERKAAQK